MRKRKQGKSEVMARRGGSATVTRRAFLGQGGDPFPFTPGCVQFPQLRNPKQAQLLLS